MFLADRITRGICTVCLLLFICLVRVIPSTLGIIISVMIRSGVSCFSRANPSSPFSAVRMAYSSDNISFSIHNNSLLSSIIRIVASGCAHLSPAVAFSSSCLFILFFWISFGTSSCFWEEFSVISSWGNVTVNWAYWFTSLSTFIIPWSNSTILWQIASPNPFLEDNPLILFSLILSNTL